MNGRHALSDSLTCSSLKTLSIALLVLDHCAAHAAAGAQEPHRLPPVRVEATVIERNGHWPDSVRALVRDSLARGRARWQRSRPPEYLVGTIVTLAMVFPRRDPADDGQLEALRVRGDSVVGIVRRPAPQFTPAPPWTRVTIDRVFIALEAAVASPTRRIVTLTLDSLWGFPRSWQTDDAQNGYSSRYVTDQGTGGAVVFFEPVATRPCAWWRRLLSRCR